MENKQNKLVTSSEENWLYIAEKVAVFGSIGGSIVGILFQKSLYASLPISISLALNLLNRQKMVNSSNQRQNNQLTTIVEKSQDSQANIETIVTSIQQQNSDRASQLEEFKKSINTKIVGYEKETTSFKEEIQEIKNSLFMLNKVEQELDTELLNLNQQQAEISKVVHELKIFGSNDISLDSDQSSPKFYTERGKIYLENKNFNHAIEDLSKAIELDKGYAYAYYHRGMAYLEKKEPRKAILDLRQASQLYFDSQDLERYNQIRNIIQNTYCVETELEEKKLVTEEKIGVNDLFS